MRAHAATRKPLVIRAAGGTDVGCVRDRNEDAFLVDAENGIFIVADGVGGHGGGDKAALMATTLLPDIIRRRIAESPASHSSDDPAIATMLADSLRELGHRIREAGASRLEYKDMGATVVVALLTTHHAHIAHMGDSRAYLLRDSDLRQLTEDHSIVGLLVRNGEITPQEAVNHPAKGRLSRFAGMEADVPAASRTIELQPGDRLLLCTDGLWGMLPDAQLTTILAEGNDPEVTCCNLLAAGKQAGGEDNLTAAVCEMTESTTEYVPDIVRGSGIDARSSYSPVSEPLCCVPLYAMLDTGEADFRGSGTLVRFWGNPLLVTAAHVIDNGRKFLRMMIGGPNPAVAIDRPALVTPVRAGLTRATDPLDFCVIRLTISEADRIQSLFQFVEWEREALTESPCANGFPHRITGYPETGNMPNYDTAKLRANCLQVDVKEDRVAMRHAPWPDMKANPHEYIALRYDPRLLSKRQYQPKVPSMHGCSGGGIWRTDTIKPLGFAGILIQCQSPIPRRTGERLVYGFRAKAMDDLLTDLHQKGAFR